MLYINPQITINEWELSERFDRASGPGGQHVNKVSTAVTLRFEAARCPALTPAIKTRLKKLAGRQWTRDGAIIITAEKHRSQVMNRELAREKLSELIHKALIAPKHRRPTRPTKASQQRRLNSKSKRGMVKALRGRVNDND